MRYADPTYLRTHGPRILAMGTNRSFPKLADTVSGKRWSQIGALSPVAPKQPEASRLHPPKLPAAPLSTGDA